MPAYLIVYRETARPLRTGRPKQLFWSSFRLEDAQAWYQSPAYQAALLHRKKAADYRVIIVQGISSPREGSR
jgi:uncharacterized protein (DUF1330 family)